MVNHPLHRLFVPLFYPFTYHSLIWLNNSLSNIKIFPDTTRILKSAIDNGVTLNYTATEDCCATITVVGNSSISITLNGVKILQPGTVSNISPSAISLFLKTGDVIKSSNAVRFCIMGLR